MTRTFLATGGCLQSPVRGFDSRRHLSSLADVDDGADSLTPGVVIESTPSDA
jgi:hypothetical protein